MRTPRLASQAGVLPLSPDRKTTQVKLRPTWVIFWRRQRDSNPRGFGPNGFQELEIVSRFGAISSLNLPDFPEKKPFLRPFPDIPWKFARKMRENNQKHYGSNATE